MKNVTLISPPEKHILMEAGDRPYMGLLYVASALRKEGHRPIISDLNHDSYKQLNDKLAVSDMAGMITFTPYFDWTVNQAKSIKQNFPKIKLIAGGPHATVESESLSPYFDHIIRGEGERAIVDIANGLENKVIDGGTESEIDNLPSPFSELDINKYGLSQEGKKTMTLLSSRSCNYHCSFCTKDILGKRQRYHSIDRVLDEIKQAKKLGFDSIYFLDDHFTSDKKRTLKLTERLGKLRITYRASTRTDKVDEDIMKALKNSGCRSLGYGLEHMDDNVLKNINKNNSVKNHLKAIRLAHKYGIRVRGTFITNLPGANQTTNIKTLQLAKRENLEFADFYALTAYPGTPIWNSPEKYGLKVNKSFGFNQNSTISNVDNGNFKPGELSYLITKLRNEWADFKGLSLPWQKKYE